MKMNADDAVKYVAEFVRSTGLPASQAVREVWKDITPITDADVLLQFAIAIRVSSEYRRPGFIYEGYTRKGESGGKGNGHARIRVRHTKYETRHYTVSVELLQDIRYNVNGKVKAIAQCNRHDILTLAESFRKGEEGFARHRAVMEYIATRLKELNKTNVEDLAEGEKIKIARMISDLRHFRFPADLPQLPPNKAGKA